MDKKEARQMLPLVRQRTLEQKRALSTGELEQLYKTYNTASMTKEKESK